MEDNHGIFLNQYPWQHDEPVQLLIFLSFCLQHIA